MHVIFYEVSLALRRLTRRPAQSLLILGTLTVSLALSLLGWSLFHTLFLRQPDYDPAGTLYRIGVTGEVTRGRIIQVTREDVEAWQAAQTVFADFAPAMLYQSTFLTTDVGTERFLGCNVSAEVMRMVGAKPLLGRLFTPEEDRIGTTPVVLLSEKLWRTRFDAAPDIVGRIVLVNSVPATVVGVMPAAFVFPNAQDLWQPLGFSPYEKAPTMPFHDIAVRLKPGISRARAEEDLRVLAGSRGPDSFLAKYNLHPVLTPFREYYLHTDMRRSALVLFALSLVFILVSCANAANLVMIDFFGRRAEIAATLALGIPRAAAVRGLFYQLLALALIAAAIACVALVLFGPYVHGAMARVTTPYWLHFSLQPHHFLIALTLALGSVGVALLVPLGYVALANVEQLMRGHMGSTRTTGRGTWRHLLLIGQIALLTVLAISAGLLLRSAHHVSAEHWGFDAQPIFSSKTSAPETAFPTPEVRLTAHLRLLEELERVPTVAAAGLMTSPVGFSHQADLAYGRTPDELEGGSSLGMALWSAVTPNLFRALGVPFVEGETFAPETKADVITPVVITAGVAQKLWSGESAIGREFHVRYGIDPKQPAQRVIVRGVLRPFQAAGPKATNNEGIYAPIMGGMAPASFLFVRGRQVLPAYEELRAAAARVDPRLALYLPNNLRQVIDTELSSVHLTTQLTSAYATAAVLLCLIGIYSITVSQVLQRQREFGIRLALGIDAGRLWMRFARGHLLTAAIGLGLGLVGAAAVVKLLSSLLFGIGAHDLATFALVALLILAIAAIACIPSLFRLRRVNPADCLRSL